jgi:hypothetical protein
MSAADKAYRAFVEREMPWLLDDPVDDAEKLLRTTAHTAFERGFDAASQATAMATKTAHRKGLEPHLVNLIAGLRHHQVEEAVRLLLDYVDAGDGGAA